LFRDYVNSEPIAVNDLSIRFAENKDYSFLLQQEGELYETPDELKKFVNGHNVILFQKDDQLLGCGYLIKVHPNYDYFDIGMWVNPNFRKQGIATLIISYVKDTCLKSNWIPICGCAVENMASQKTLEKNGFISKHKLIEFAITNKQSTC
jgi:RimJ/RimL family protein N-acetyltransferase